ncbi:hypothetical protein IKS38_00075 [bacterium]|nr:hypothetical protein [bacterium]
MKNAKPCCLFYLITATILIVLIILLILHYSHTENIQTISWPNFGLAILASLLASVLAAFIIDVFKYFRDKTVLNAARESILMKLIAIAVKFSEQLFYVIYENEKEHKKNMTIKEVVDKFNPNTYTADCQTCERALIQAEFMYKESVRVKETERGLLDTKELNQINTLISSYERYLNDYEKCLDEFKTTRDKFQCDIHYDSEKAEISFDPYLSLNSSLSSFVLMIKDLYSSDGIFKEVSNKELLLNEYDYIKLENHCRKCESHCKPNNFKDI